MRFGEGSLGRGSGERGWEGRTTDGTRQTRMRSDGRPLRVMEGEAERTRTHAHRHTGGGG